MESKRKRSRWDDGEDLEENMSTQVKVKVENLGDHGDISSTFAIKNDSKVQSQPFKWGEKIKIEGEEDSNESRMSRKIEGEGGHKDGGKNENNPKEKAKANFGLTGALAKDEKSGNLRNGVVLKYSEALDAGVPPNVWRLYVFNGDELEETLYIHRQASYLIGKDRRVSDIILSHNSCSKQHAVLVFRNVEVTDTGNGSVRRVNRPYLLDLKSTNKTFLNGDEIEDSRYYELREQDCIRFGAGKVEYVLLHDKSAKANDQ